MPNENAPGSRGLRDTLTTRKIAAIASSAAIAGGIVGVGAGFLTDSENQRGQGQPVATEKMDPTTPTTNTGILPDERHIDPNNPNPQNFPERPKVNE